MLPKASIRDKYVLLQLGLYSVEEYLGLRLGDFSAT